MSLVGEMMSVVEAIIRTKSIHLVRESVHLSEPWNFKIYGGGKLTFVENGETNHLDHLQHDFYVDISYKFTLEWVCVL